MLSRMIDGENALHSRFLPFPGTIVLLCEDIHVYSLIKDAGEVFWLVQKVLSAQISDRNVVNCYYEQRLNQGKR
jgi:hypothetical protein